MKKTIERIRITLELLECAFCWFMARHSNWQMAVNDYCAIDLTRNTERQRKYQARGKRVFRRYADRYSREPWAFDGLMKEDREYLEVVAISFGVKKSHGYTAGPETKREISNLILAEQKRQEA